MNQVLGIWFKKLSEMQFIKRAIEITRSVLGQSAPIPVVEVFCIGQEKMTVFY